MCADRFLFFFFFARLAYFSPRPPLSRITIYCYISFYRSDDACAFTLINRFAFNMVRVMVQLWRLLISHPCIAVINPSSSWLSFFRLQYPCIRRRRTIKFSSSIAYCLHFSGSLCGSRFRSYALTSQLHCIVLFLFSVLFISTKHKGAPLYADAETAVYTRQALRSVVSLVSVYFYQRQVTELDIDEPQTILFASMPRMAYSRHDTLSMWVERIGVIEIDLDEFYLFIRHILRIDAGVKWWTENPWKKLCGEWKRQQQAY